MSLTRQVTRLAIVIALVHVAGVAPAVQAAPPAFPGAVGQGLRQAAAVAAMFTM